MKRSVFFIFGSLMTALGIVGLWIPGLPTVPLLLLALWTFSRADTRIAAWLSQTKLFAPIMYHVHELETNNAVARNIKVISLLSAWGSTGALMITLGLLHGATIVMFIASVVLSIVISKLKTSTPHDQRGK
jgi:uncharacterized protein